MNLTTKNRPYHPSQARTRACWLEVLSAALLLLSMPLWAAPTDMILVIDNSGSMRQNDPAFLLKGAVTKFFAALPADTHAGVLIFDQKVTYPVPLAPVDSAVQGAVKGALAKVDYRGQYTNIPAAMERAIYELKSGARKDAAKVVVFMTDGIVDTGNPAVDAEKAKWLRDELASDAADSGIRIFGIAFTENADFFLIQSLAKKTSGEYFRALKPEDLDSVFVKVEDKLARANASAPAAAATTTATTTMATEATGAEPAAAPAADAAATTASDCLAAMPADDRAAIEEMAKAAATTAEQLCLEMKNTPAGQPVVTPAPGTPMPATPATPAAADAPPGSSNSTMGVALVAGSALVLLIAAGVLVMIFIKRRKDAPAEAAPTRVTGAAAVSTAPRVPDAFIKDINGLINEPAMQLSAKPMMIGRMAGTDQDHVDYFVVEQPTIGRRHALIRYRDFCFWISDQGSVNGTFLNSERIEGERQLKHGDRIRFHKYEFEFSMPEMDHGGQTIFADPLNRTMVGDMDTMVGTAAVAGGAALAGGAIARAVADDDVFDMSGGAAAASVAGSDKTAFLSPPAALPGAAHADDLFGGDATASDGDAEFISLGGSDDIDEAAEETQLPVNLRSVMLSGTHARAEAEFDAEASAFFDEDDLAVTSSPYSNTTIESGPLLRLDDDPEDEGLDQDTMQMPAMQFTPVPAAPVDDFSESETMLPVSPSVANQTQGVDISLDSFMNTDSFESSAPGMGDFDEDDATLMPHQVPEIDDVFDVTAEGIIPPVLPKRNDDDDEDDHDRTTLLR